MQCSELFLSLSDEVVYSSLFSVYFPVTEVRRGSMYACAHAHLLLYTRARVRKLARALSLADEYHAAHTKTNFPRVLHFSAFILCCMHASTVRHCNCTEGLHFSAFIPEFLSPFLFGLGGLRPPQMRWHYDELSQTIKKVCMPNVCLN